VLVGDVGDTKATAVVRTPLERVALRVYRLTKTSWSFESALSVADVATVPPPSDAPGLLARPIANGNNSASIGLVQRVNLVPGAAQLVLAPLRDVAAGNFSRSFGVNATRVGGTCYLTMAPLIRARQWWRALRPRCACCRHCRPPTRSCTARWSSTTVLRCRCRRPATRRRTLTLRRPPS
jgi:hypothetical protein